MVAQEFSLEMKRNSPSRTIDSEKKIIVSIITTTQRSSLRVIEIHRGGLNVFDKYNNKRGKMSRREIENCLLFKVYQRNKTKN